MADTGNVTGTGTPPESPPALRDEAAVQFARTIPYWLVAIVGLIYASGFLVVTTHLERYGIRIVGTDVWKSRYIHIGVLSVVFPAMIIGTIFATWYTYGLHKQEFYGSNEPRKQYLAKTLAFRMAVSGFVFVLLEVAFYGFALFTSLDFHGQPFA